MSQTTNVIASGIRHPSEELAPVADWSEMGESEHFVQFYEHDECLVDSMSAFVGAGLRADDAAIVIATADHRAALEEQLRADGYDVAALCASGQYLPFDAAETLSQFVVNGVLQEDRFHQLLGSVVAQAAVGGRHVRAFGEMVALLWADGKPDLAIGLENLWNDLAKVHSFSLFCAYPLGGFCGEANGQPFAHVCHAHSRVIPAESYSRHTDPNERLRAISLLQQKAASLEAEIEERKAAEKALARRERELSDFLENATEGIHQVGPDGKILWANKAELDLLGYAPDEYIHHHIAEFHADSEVIREILERLARGEKLCDYEARLKHKNGSIRYVSINSSVYWEGDRFVHTKCFTRDITERKQAAEILERTVAERTVQLRETVAELDAFSFSISHDMRAPLRAMRGFADVLVKECADKLDPECRGYLDRIAAAGERMDRLIQDVLTFSRVARTDLNLEPVNLDHLVRGIVECYPNLQQPNAEIVIEGHLPCVSGNAAALTQCFSNLLGNAVKFVARGTQPSIRIWAEQVTASGEQPTPVRIYVEDNGIGIPDEARDRVFALFQRFHKNYEGTGIGLAIVKKAAERMGGKVGLSSESSQGSTFWLELTPAEMPAKK